MCLRLLKSVSMVDIAWKLVAMSLFKLYASSVVIVNSLIHSIILYIYLWLIESKLKTQIANFALQNLSRHDYLFCFVFYRNVYRNWFLMGIWMMESMNHTKWMQNFDSRYNLNKWWFDFCAREKRKFYGKSFVWKILELVSSRTDDEFYANNDIKSVAYVSVWHI